MDVGQNGLTTFTINQTYILQKLTIYYTIIYKRVNIGRLHKIKNYANEPQEDRENTLSLSSFLSPSSSLLERTMTLLCFF